MTQTNGNKR